MHDELLPDVFNSKIIHNELKADGSPVVYPIAMGDLALAVPCCFEALFKEFLCYDPCLR